MTLETEDIPGTLQKLRSGSSVADEGCPLYLPPPPCLLCLPLLIFPLQHTAPLSAERASKSLRCLKPCLTQIRASVRGGLNEIMLTVLGHLRTPPTTSCYSSIHVY